jgi:hypothetical protein
MKDQGAIDKAQEISDRSANPPDFAALCKKSLTFIKQICINEQI